MFDRHMCIHSIPPLLIFLLSDRCYIDRLRFINVGPTLEKYLDEMSYGSMLSNVEHLLLPQGHSVSMNLSKCD